MASAGNPPIFSLDAADVVAVLGPLSETSGPRYRALARALEEAISRAELPAGARLPPERALAELLAVSRSVVVSAYAALRERGLVHSRQGSGTWVHAQSTGELYESKRQTREAIPLTMANLSAPVAVSAAAAEVLASGAADEAFASHGYAPLGVQALREAIAEHYAAQGLPTTADEIIVTTGAQQAISLVSGLLLSAGDGAVVQDPTYSGAIDCLRELGVRTTGVPVDDADGIRLDRLHASLRWDLCRMVYVCAVHNPTGHILSKAAREALAQIADREGATVVEDLTLSHVTFGRRPPSLAPYAGASNVVLIESVSKVFWGGLRVGWVRAPRSFVQRMAHCKAIADLGSPILSQLVAARLVREIPTARDIVRARAGARLDTLTAELAAQLPAWEWERPLGGLSLWVRVPGVDGVEFARIAAQHGVSVVPGSVMSVAGEHADCIRIPFVLEPDEIREAVCRLAAAWAVYTASGPRANFPVLV